MGDSLQIQLQSLISILLMSIIVCLLTATPTLSINSSTNNPSTSKTQGGLVLELIHRDSIHPPTYPLGSTLLDRLDLALSRVHTRRYARLDSDSSKANRTSFPKKQLTPMYPGGNTYYVSFFIGNPLIPQLATLDTGSDILWIQCANYKKGHKTVNPTYDPVDSTWYAKSTCQPSAGYCKIAPGGRCDNQNRCEYNIRYQDGSYSTGFIGFENLTFYQPDRRDASYATNVLFGCGMDNQNINKNDDGVFGIGGLLQLSVLGRSYEKKFSYCLGGIGDLKYTSHLALGANAIIQGVPVSVSIRNGYIVTLQGITIAEKQKLTIPPIDVMIDTGSTLSYMRNDVYKQIRDTVDGLIGTKMRKVTSRVVKDALCYSAPKLTSDFPSVFLEFGPQTRMFLCIDNLFWKTPGENFFCLSVLPSTNQNLNLIGAVMQQYHNVAFDLESNQVYFNTTDCSQLI